MTPLIGTRRVMITGGGSGIGRATAALIAQGGGKAVIVGRRPQPLQSLAEAFPGRLFPLPWDITDVTRRHDLLDRASDLLGGCLDGIVHGAGAVAHQLPEHIDEDSLRAQLEVNLVAPLLLGITAVDRLEAGGCQIFISSTLARRPIATSAVYSAAKAGLLQVTRALAQVAARRQVRVNAILPGVVKTEMVRMRSDDLCDLHPLGRLGDPDDVAKAIHYLLGAEWVTGSELVIDGGLLIRD
jgi:NAD(P)-dependent dehydrogenase (short-subunit alcohol dehydrogenase family)